MSLDWTMDSPLGDPKLPNGRSKVQAFQLVCAIRAKVNDRTSVIVVAETWDLKDFAAWKRKNKALFQAVDASPKRSYDKATLR